MNASLSKILNQKSLPSLPTVAAQILDLVARSDSTLDELTNIVRTDPQLAGKILKYCNSPVIGSRREIGDLSQAVVILGMRTVRLISLSFSLVDMENDLGFDYQKFWRDSLSTAIASQLVAEHTNNNPNESFLQGLMLNVGAIGLANTYPDEYAEMISKTPTIDLDKETAVFRVHRYIVGARLLEKWCLPKHMIELLEQFNPAELTAETRPFYLAQLIAELVTKENVLPTEIDEIRELANEWFSIDETGFSDLYDRMLVLWSSYGNLFELTAIRSESLEVLEERAKQYLVAAAMGLEQELQEANAEVEDLEKDMMRDSLTQLKNRRAYDSEIVETHRLHQREKQSFGLLVIDIDHFKAINDTHGHAAGDQVLREVGRTLKERCRIYDTVYRYGGEEFVAVVANCSTELVEMIAQRFREAIEELRISFEGKTLNVTVSLGACVAEVGMEESTDELFKIADARLYRAKEAGRNCCIAGEAVHHHMHCLSKHSDATA